MFINSKLKIFAFVFLSFLLCAGSAQARWWIFGKAKGKPEVTKLFIGGIDTQSIDGTIYFFRNHLKDGLLEIKGFDRPASGAQVVQARISLNGGRTWEEKVTLETNNFYFSFKPQPMKTYHVLVSLMDARGQENDPGDLPRISFIYQDTTAEAVAEDGLRELARQYSQRSYRGFINLISEEYRGDRMSLEDAVAKDFLNYRQLSMSVIPSRTLIENLDARIDFHYDISATKASDGSVATVSGQTSYTLRMERNSYKLLQMMPPILFGSSAGPGENPTGEGGSTGVNTQGKTLGGSSSTPAPGVQQGSGSVKDGTLPSPAYDFENGKNTAMTPNSYDINASFIPGFHPQNIFTPYPQAGIQFVGAVPLDSVKTAPSSGYTNDSRPVSVGYTYAVQTRDGFYALFQVKTVDTANKTITFDYLFQSNGSRIFFN